MDDDTDKLARAYYARLEGFGREANVGTTIGGTYSPKVAAKIIRDYLEFRGYKKIPRNVTLEYVSMLLLELDTKDEKTRCGLSLMLIDSKNSPKLD